MNNRRFTNRSIRNRKVYRTDTERIVFRIAKTLFVLLWVCFFFSLNALGNEKAYFSTATDEAESKYMSDIKMALHECGISNAGITMTKTSVDGFNIEYEVRIHTSKIYKNLLSEKDIAAAVNNVLLAVPNSGTNIIFE